jgi:hypothetical protein
VTDGHGLPGRPGRAAFGNSENLNLMSDSASGQTNASVENTLLIIMTYDKMSLSTRAGSTVSISGPLAAASEVKFQVSESDSDSGRTSS